MTAVPAQGSTDVPVTSKERIRPALDVVDAQIHVRGEAELAIAAMDAVGVEQAVVDIWPPDIRTTDNGATRYDFGLMEHAIERFPGRFGYMGRVDPGDPELDDLMMQFAATPNVVCVRTHSADLQAGRDAPVLAAAGRYGMPVMTYVSGYHEAMMRYVTRFDEVQFILDHVAMNVVEVRELGAARPPASSYVDALMAYAPFANVAVKWAHAPRLSLEGYPFRDVVEQLARTVETFGPERIVWGSDYTVVRDHHTYAEALFSLRDTDLLSGSEKEWVLGKALRRLLSWPRISELSPPQSSTPQPVSPNAR
jgi:L-fuconolactonase